MDDSIDSDSLSVRDYLPLIGEDSVTYIHSCRFCETETSFCTELIFKKLSEFLFAFSVVFAFCPIFDASSSTIDEIFSINTSTSANVFVFGYFNIHYQD